MKTLPPQLSALAEYTQFILWKRVQNANGKVDKLPVSPYTGQVCDPHDPANWATADFASAALAAGIEAQGLAFAFTEADPFFFIDLDHALVIGQWSELALRVMGMFPEAAKEISQSGTGGHIIGKGHCGPHKCKNIAAGLELYTEKRFVALTGTGIVGDAGTEHSAALQALVEEFFTPEAAVVAHGDGPDPEWRGPADDDELIRRAMASKSVASVFGQRASFADLWERRVDVLSSVYPGGEGRDFDESSADAALLSHLAFWTGRDAERMHRLMLRSGLVREKWNRPDYLQRSIDSTLARPGDVLKDKGRYAEPSTAADRYAIRDVEAQRSTVSEMARAPLTPRCIVNGYLYADVAVLAGPGAVGKSTLQLYEAVCIILGRQLWGRSIVGPGPIVYVTAEDDRSQIFSRLWHVMQAMQLADDECERVADNFFVYDVCGEDLRLVLSAAGGDIVLTAMANEIVSAYRSTCPALVVFDPLVSFGSDEGRVNTNEQAVITAMRRIRRGLDCCVRAIHHTGQEAALSKRTDQYATRGGTALPDGCRMVAIAHTWRQGDSGMPPKALLASEGEHTVYTQLSLPKVSYVAPQPAIWIRRDGWAYQYAIENRLSPEEAAREKQNQSIAQLAEDANQVERFIIDQLGQGRKHTSNSLDTAAISLGISRQRLRAAVSELIVLGRMREEPLASNEKQGRRKEYLCPVEAPRSASNLTVEPANLTSIPPIPPHSAVNPPADLEQEEGMAEINSAIPPFPIGGGIERGGIETSADAPHGCPNPPIRLADQVCHVGK